ncbi:MAG: adenylate/guanylate cyclase domain-containing protein, partial [Acidimicrobiales bacterium]
LVVYLLNRHLVDAAIRRLSYVRSEPSTSLTVGFADLVGFTRLSQELRDAEIAELVEHFESIASDTVVANGGRVVKMIGDEIMWSAPSGRAPEIALLLTESFDGPDLPGVRVGLACGTVVTRAGDLFGPTVNLASRATGVAHPGTVLASSDLFEVVDADGRYRLKKLRPRRLKGLGLVELGVVQRA